MPKNVLIASLGDHPAVVTGMVKKLDEDLDLAIQEVVVLYTKGSGKLISLGYELIKQTLTGKNIAVPEVGLLPFADPLTRTDSILFLQILAGVLESYEANGENVYISMAGGRKNTSALLGVITQFYPAVKGLFHLLDKSGQAFPAIEELVYLAEAQKLAKMEPPGEHMELVPIPYACFANAYELRRYFRATEKNESYAVDTSGLAEEFFRAIWHSPSEAPLQIYFSQMALNEYKQMEGTSHQRIFDSYFRDMRKPEWLKALIHPLENFETDCYCLKKGGRGAGSIQERPFVYREGDRVVVCRLTLHGSTYEELMAKGELWRKDQPPVKALAQLGDGETILLVPLGESPMVASQTYTLLQTPDREWDQHKVAEVVVIYPAENGLIENGAYMLSKAFAARNVKFKEKPIPGLEDVDSTENCKIYLRAVLAAIEEVRRDQPDKQVALSLSGGRKGMSALTLFAAQRAGIDQVYHTLITDPALEQQVMQEGEYDRLKSKSRAEQDEILFLKRYDPDKFTLFPIPVIALVDGEGAVAL
ncbi:MAG: hypothetical protein KJ077_22310 [Anaerolineae bacterium]|nr:hypothetical protein [Anaerolineae bacterium]